MEDIRKHIGMIDFTSIPYAIVHVMHDFDLDHIHSDGIHTKAINMMKIYLVLPSGRSVVGHHLTLPRLELGFKSRRPHHPFFFIHSIVLRV